MSKVLVVGASRGIGKQASQVLAHAGHSVRAMSRSGRVSAFGNGQIENFVGDALVGEDIKRALEGIDTVVQALGVKANAQMITGPVTLFSSATRVLIPAMQQAQVSRLIAVTGFGAGDCASAISPLQRIPFRATLGRAYDDKTVQEELIEKSGLDWMLVRPGVLTNGPRSGRYKAIMEPSRWRNGIISRADVADFIKDHIEDEPLGGRKAVLIRWPFLL
ncbi:MAG: SDR family oxidoreductase [Devosiaceae bacterium]|nr:SDR family oxidoreductase [Devosiaceae bacterium MH13]